MQGQAEPAFDFGKQINDSTANGKPPLLLFTKKKVFISVGFRDFPEDEHLSNG